MTHTLTPAHIEILGQVDPFERLDRVALARLASCADPLRFGAGDVVCHQGDEADGLYVVIEGVFDIFGRNPDTGEDALIGTSAHGTVLGELALLFNETRTATIRARTDGELLRVEKGRFLELMRTDPAIGIGIAATLGRRMRERDHMRAANGAFSAEMVADASPVALRDQRDVALLKEASAGDAQPSRVRTRIGIGLSVACVLLAALTAPGAPIPAFALLLVAAVCLWIIEVAPASAVALGLMVAWILTGLAAPTEAASGFATPDWLFVLSIYGIAVAVARSGLIFRTGLLLVRRMPGGLFWQAGTLLLTGIMLTPLLPTSTGRAALTASLSTSVTESLRIRDRQPAAAVLGLAAWIGAGPLLFTFLNGSSLCLLAWGLMPEANRQAFGWVTWLLAAVPLGLVVALGSLVMLFVVLRPSRTETANRQRVEVQLTVLGPPTRREIALTGVLIAMVVGLIAAPVLQLTLGVIAVVALLACVAVGCFDRQALRELDWDYLIFYGVALSLARLSAALGVDSLVGDTVSATVAGWGGNALLIVLGIALLTIVVRIGLPLDQAVLLLCLALIPPAAGLGLDAWVVIITILVASGVWLIPSQNPTYLAAYSASEGRLYSPAQSRRAAVGFAVVVLVGLTVSVPYWHLLGLL